MDRWSTKTPEERQDDEASRLVRPAPKQKPPRRDLRRERVTPEADPDQEKDPDESRNFKDIGGSVGRVVRRFARNERIPAKNKETGETVQISPDTLKEKPGQYEAVKPEEEAERSPNPVVPESKEETSPAEQSTPKPTDKEQFYQQAGDQLREMSKGDARLKDIFKRFITPGETLNGIVEGNPDLPASKFFPKVDLPDSIKTIGDLKAALETKPSVAPKTKGKKKPVEPPAPAEPAAEPAPKQEEPKTEVPKGDPAQQPTPSEGESAPKAEPTKEEPAKEPAQEEKPSKKKLKPPSEGQRHGIGEPVRKPPTEADQQEALSLLLNTFEPEEAANFASMHPQDVKTLVRDYNTAKLGVKISKPTDFAEKVGHFYQIDPAKVKPPTYWRKSGERVPFDTLSDEEKAEALRSHQMRMVALSLAARDSLTQKLANKSSLTGKPRIPEKIAGQIAKTLLSNPSPKVGDKLAAKIYKDTLASGEETARISDRAVKELLKQVDGNPVAAKATKAYLQANDYRLAKEQFLTNSSSGNISERDTPEGILSGLKKAGQYFQKRNALYGDDHSINPSQKLFRTRLMNRLRTLDPEKATKVQQLLGPLEHKEYKALHKRWSSQYSAWANRKTKHEEALQAYMKNPQGKPPGGFVEEAPPEPEKPVTGSPEEGPDKASDIWDDAFSQNQHEDASHEAVKQASVFTYSRTHVMGSTSKTSVYHGVDPYAYGAPDYPGWMQPHQRDLGESDWTTILAEARQFLGSSLLDVADPGVDPDAQLRAALDLAIYSSRYNGAVNATQYANLLAKLAGKPQPSTTQTLLTVTEKSGSSDSTSSFNNTLSATIGEVTPMKSSRTVREFAAKVAKFDAKTAFEMTDFADRLAEQEQQDKEQEQKTAGELPPWLKKDDDKEEKKDDKEEKKEAAKYASLKALVIKTASETPAAARAAFRPLLQALKNLG